MTPELVVRAYLGTLVAERNGWQGPRRRRRARQRDRFLAWLVRWAKARK